jgi:hypothetical protein
VWSRYSIRNDTDLDTSVQCVERLPSKRYHVCMNIAGAVLERVLLDLDPVSKVEAAGKTVWLYWPHLPPRPG